MFQQLDTAIAFVVVMLMLSLLVTAMVQAISALFDLRGKNLTRALSDLFRQIDSSLSAAPAPNTALKGAKLWLDGIKDWCAHPFSKVTLARKAADAVAKHPVLAHTYTRAKAIRKEELLNVLKDLCSDAPAGTIDPTVKSKLREILSSQVPGGLATVDTAKALVTQLGSKFPDLKLQLDQVVVERLGSVSRLEVEIEKWFATVMDRASDVFTRWTRIITVAISILLVGILHIDSGLIFHQISTSPEIRAGLTKLSDTALAQADETLQSGDRGKKALQLLADRHKEDGMGSDLQEDAHAQTLVTCVDGKRWLEEYGTKKRRDISQLQQEFADACQQLTAAALSGSEDQISRMRQELAATDLKIVPELIESKPPFGRAGDSLRERIKCWGLAYGSKSHALGTLAMVVLLSLGAPFWYNALKQLSNLKPSITQKIEKESAAP
jgi:hypothetical protein